MGLDIRESAVPTVDQETCIGCGECVQICSSGYLAMRDGKPRPEASSFLGCIACGHCMAVCPTESITVDGRGLAPKDRIELPPVGQRANVDQLDALMFSRRSVRRFTDEEIDRGLLERIVQIASTAPMGVPPHEVGIVVFHGRRRVQGFAADATAAFRKAARTLNPVVLTLMRPFLGKAQHAILRDFVRPLLQLIVRKRSEGVDALTYDAPAAMLFHRAPGGDPADCHIVATYAMLAAESLALGSCLLGTTAGLDHDKGFKRKHEIPTENRIGLGLVLGHSAVEFQRGIRRRLKSVKYPAGGSVGPREPRSA